MAHVDFRYFVLFAFLRFASRAATAFFALAVRSAGVMAAAAFLARSIRSSGVRELAAFLPPMLPCFLKNSKLSSLRDTLRHDVLVHHATPSSS